MSNVANKEILKQTSMIPAVRYNAELKMMKTYNLDDEWKESRSSLVWMLIAGIVIISIGFLTTYKIAEVSIETIETHKEQAVMPDNITGSY